MEGRLLKDRFRFDHYRDRLAFCSTDRNTLWLCCLVGLLGLSSNASAQTSAAVLDEVVVTAQKRQAIAHDVPLSLQVLNSEQLREASLGKVEELQNYLPGLYMSEAGLGTVVSVRGFFSGVNPGFEQSVGTYVDGVYRGRSQQLRAPFFDLKRIELLRGPQSALFGSNSVAGALSLITASPTDQPDGAVSLLHVPELDRQQINSHLSGPISSTVNGRIALLANQEDGYIDNVILDRSEPSRDELSVRGSIDWQPNQQSALRLRLEHGDFDVDGRQVETFAQSAATSGPFAGLNYPQALALFGGPQPIDDDGLDFRRAASADSSDNSWDELVLTFDHQLTDHQLTFATAWSRYEFNERCDCDFVAAPIFEAAFAERFRQLSQELRLASNTDRPFSYTLGAAWEKHELRYDERLEVVADSLLVPIVNALTASPAGQLLAETAVPRAFQQDYFSASLFLHSRWQMMPRASLAAGLRLTHQHKDGRRTLSIEQLDGLALAPEQAPFTLPLYAGILNIRPHDLSDETSEFTPLPSLTFEYLLSDSAYAYLNWARGSKAGGFDVRSNNSPRNGGAFEFDDERSQSIDLGLKLRLFDGAAELNSAIYHVDFDDLQVSAFDGVLGFNVGNAARARSHGFEANARWAISEHLLAYGSIATTDFKFKQYAGQCAFGQPADAADGINCDYAGRTNQFVADWNAQAGLRWSRPLSESWHFLGRIDWIGSDEFFLAPTLDQRQIQPAYVRTDVRIELQHREQHWSIALVGRNLSDETIATYSDDIPLGGALFSTPSSAALLAAPRTIGIEARYQLGGF